MKLTSFYATGKYVLVLILILLNSSCAKLTTTREHPVLEEQLLSIDKVLVISPTVAIQKINFSSDNERHADAEGSIKQGLMDVAKTELASKGYELLEFDLDKAVMEDEDLAYALNQVKEGFEQAKATLYEKSLNEEEKRTIKASVGTAINALVEKTGADSFLIFNYAGFEKSGGSVAKDVAVSVLFAALGTVAVQSTEGSYVEVALIDGVTGDVLWCDVGRTSDLDTSAAEALLEKMPSDIDPAPSADSVSKSQQINNE